MNHYEVLGLTRKARAAEIKRAYKRLARQHHPDLNPGDRKAEERFKAIAEAYDVLGDAQKKKAYDRELDGVGFQGRGGAAANPAAWGFESAFDPANAGDFSAFVSEIFGGGAVDAAARNVPRRGDDVTRPLSLGFFDALNGWTAKIGIDAESTCGRCTGSGRVPAATRRPCPDCAGTGRINRLPGPLRLTTICRRCEGEGMLSWDGCGACAGTGILTRREEIDVRIPAGVDDGSRVRIAGRGRAGRLGGPPGDLIIVTQVEPHPFFRRIGDNIHCAVPITVSEAALGSRIEVPTIDGRARIRIPPGTETGQKFRLRGKGAPSLRGTARGDQYVETRIVTPHPATDRERRLLEELGSLENGEDLRRNLAG
ncbi:MAG TPA: J domain-containing protein [Candidatus Polarisedimenticolia bacterium]|nr:J domain-containing protein [Candidatus Polarisedimenticolia bacterium]